MNEILLTILAGVPITLLLTAGALVVGVLGGIPLVAARQSRAAILRLPARATIELLRGIPPIVWLFIIFFGLGTYVRLDAMSAAAIGLGLISCAYLAEIYRGGLAAIAKGQWEASAALGMPRTATLTRVIGPQVGRVCIPAAASYAIGLLKDTSVAFTIGVTEILYWANDQSRETSDAFWPFVLAAVVYIVMTIPCAWAARALDASLRKRVAR
ncbi:polar amino acid transport system permease protein [Kribbella sp. VKM Ac-2527]|uniref:Polar amino acid transport system permease protein n=1 Tax=Kribbella caucasensis TaxID=2512215 RepID=A0A4R6KD42_9ACTN|nr:amino acid ABC transporter permease [Kribbella sp. VKM Ac-2527]TDO46385.1 polar amino acid transport system permease protein [Kribbella sp. VKM Ac-2527]